MESAEPPSESAFDQAQALHRAGRLLAAEILYEHALSTDPDHGPTLHMAGVLATQLSKTELGVARLERALASGYRTASLLDHYGIAKQHQGDLPAAIQHFREGLRLDPASGSLWFNLGLAQRHVGQLAAAITAFTQAAPLLDQAPARYALGLTLQEAGRPEEAAAAYRQALALDPADAKSALNAGVIAQQAGDLAGAIELYEAALASDPALLVARINLASAWHDSGDWARAAAAFEAVLPDAPGNAELLNNLGATRRCMGDVTQAELLFRRALAIDPLHPAANDNLTQLLRDTGRGKQAIALRRSLCTALPGEPRAWLELARVLRYAGEDEPALEMAVALDPTQAEAHCRLGDCAQRRQDWPLAMQHYRRAAHLAPGRAEPRTGLALAALKAGDGPAALAACDALLARNRFDQAAIAYRILALRQCGDLAQAEWLSDPDALVTTMALDVQPAELAALAQALRAVQHRIFAPKGQSVRGGTQTGNELFAERSPAIQAFRKRLDGVLAQYLADRARDDAHPFFAARPGTPSYHSWSVVLQAAGHHVAHIHPGGCISGVFYVAAPPFQGGDDAGCLEIGPPGLDVPLPAPPPLRLIRAAPGQLVLFPSYLWHGTRPFQGAGERITIAFDVRHGLQPLPSDRW